MSSDKYRDEFAELASRAFREVYAEAFEATGEEQVFSAEFIRENLEKPKDPTMGRFAFPVFRYGKLLSDKPPKIALAVTNKVNEYAAADGSISITCSNVAGFINTAVSFSSLAGDVVKVILDQGNEYGSSDIGHGKKYLVEYCSANIAKPFGIGHLRSTILGNSLRLINDKLGFETVGINYLGDWGTQFGKMIVAFRKWGGNIEFSGGDDTKNDVRRLFELYVRFHKEAEDNPALDDEGRAAFKQLESGDAEARALWDKFKAISLAEFDRIFSLLGVEFDVITGEAHYNDKMDAVIERFEKAGLTEISDGAEIVDLKDEQLPPLLLRRSDGATLYATRDLAALIDRWQEYRFHELLYVVAAAQSDHFKQLFKAIAMLEEAEGQPVDDRISERAQHVSFGWVMFKDRTMSTRRGEIIFLEEVIDQARDLARQMIVEKNPGLENIDETATMIGVGAVLFSQLSVRKNKDVNFDWAEVLSFEGETGPYLQYTHARLCSLMRNFDGAVRPEEINVRLLEGDEEQRLVELLADFPQAIVDAARSYDPYILSAYLLRLASAFNKFYQRKDEDGRVDKIISEDRALTMARIGLVKCTQIVVNEGLHLLGIKAPQAM